MRLVPVLFVLSSGLALAAGDDDWFENDPYEKALAVNEGELSFLAKAPERPAHHHDNRLQITEQSLESGWVRLQQCHSDIDPVASSQVLFREGRVRNLKVERFEHIGRAYVYGHSVQLEDVQPGARLCLSAETRALHRIDAHTVELRNGPYMRRFLDGYYPMRVTLDIRYPPQLVLTEHFPHDSNGARLRLEPQHILLDTWFEGMLRTHFRFVTRP